MATSDKLLTEILIRHIGKTTFNYSQQELTFITGEIYDLCQLHHVADVSIIFLKKMFLTKYKSNGIISVCYKRPELRDYDIKVMFLLCQKIVNDLVIQTMLIYGHQSLLTAKELLSSSTSESNDDSENDYELC